MREVLQATFMVPYPLSALHRLNSKMRLANFHRESELFKRQSLLDPYLG